MIIFNGFSGNQLMCRRMAVNYSDEASSASASASNNAEVDTLNRINCVIEYILAILSAGVNPILILVSIFGNTVIVRRLPQSAVSKKAKFFYVSIAIGDIICTTVISLHYFIGQGLRYWTNGRFYFYLETMNHATCVLYRSVQAIAVVFSNSLTMTLAIERCIATASPFSSMKIPKLRYTCVLIVFFNVIGLSLVIAHSPLYSLERNRDYAFGGDVFCSPLMSRSATAMNVILFSYLFITPFAVIVICCAIMLTALRRRNRKMMRRQSHIVASDSSASHVQLIMVLSIIDFVLYVSFSLLWLLFKRLHDVGSIYNPTLRRSAMIFLLMSGLSHSLNFIVFMARSKSFRNAVLGSSSLQRIPQSQSQYLLVKRSNSPVRTGTGPNQCVQTSELVAHE